ncbi:MAG: methylated-DNA--[protein]-cysteine S-methyltransferase [Paraglaciecola sp.]|nr:methylated-DNA--[protein]-cysteine S-methyltransferase [Paraglaciecola sp.]NCT49417.1 methylated-DNA--[protein]-cysteine S-methyltransferase [Paraglaciecola sp.]
MNNTQFLDYWDSPLGCLAFSASCTGLTSIKFVSEHQLPIFANKYITSAKTQLEEYFLGKRRTFDLSLDSSGTEFQQSVWQALLTIPYGEKRSYRDIALAIDKPKAVRAVGAANGRNPFTIVVPCHRVIGANGSLTGYAWGVDIKAQLLRHEAQYQ